jgi:hypothetical protein
VQLFLLSVINFFKFYYFHHLKIFFFSAKASGIHKYGSPNAPFFQIGLSNPVAQITYEEETHNLEGQIREIREVKTRSIVDGACTIGTITLFDNKLKYFQRKRDRFLLLTSNDRMQAKVKWVANSN